jgi:hypothetical protein
MILLSLCALAAHQVQRDVVAALISHAKSLTPEKLTSSVRASWRAAKGIKHNYGKISQFYN